MSGAFQGNFSIAKALRAVQGVFEVKDSSIPRIRGFCSDLRTRSHLAEEIHGRSYSRVLVYAVAKGALTGGRLKKWEQIPQMGR